MRRGTMPRFRVDFLNHAGKVSRAAFIVQPAVNPLAFLIDVAVVRLVTVL